MCSSTGWRDPARMLATPSRMMVRVASSTGRGTCSYWVSAMNRAILSVALTCVSSRPSAACFRADIGKQGKVTGAPAQPEEPLLLVVPKIAQQLRAGRMAQLAQRLRLDLAD